MGGRKRIELAADLQRLKGRFDAWRASRRPGQRIPEALWNRAVKLVAKHGLNRTSSVLGLDFYSLQKRVKSSTSSADSTPAFIALPAAPAASHSEWILEFEKCSGDKMRVHFQGGEVDVLSLSRSFWNAD